MERLASPGRTAASYWRIGSPSLRQLSTMEKIAASLGPASLLPRCTQFFRPMARGRMEFSARLVLNSNSGYSRKRVSLSHSARAYRAALPAALLGSTFCCAARLQFQQLQLQVTQRLARLTVPGHARQTQPLFQNLDLPPRVIQLLRVCLDLLRLRIELLCLRVELLL